MIFDKTGNTTILYQENISLIKFVENLNNSYSKIKKDHLIINLFYFSNITSDYFLYFLQLSNKHRAANKSFVLVTKKVEYDQVPDEICLVPTVQEAKDIIEMEEIERDLDL